MNRLLWVLSVTFCLVIFRSAIASTPEQDIVKIESAVPISDTEQIPGFHTGQQIYEVLNNALKLINENALESVHLDLQEATQDLQRCLNGEGFDSPLPSSYQQFGELWLPVKAEQLKILLDAPDLLPRPRQGGAAGKVGNLNAQALRVTWLPVNRTISLLKQILPLGVEGRMRMQRQLESMLSGLRSRLELLDRPLILAYYQVERALSSASQWDQDDRNRLRMAAEGLNHDKRLIHYANRLQAQSNRLVLDMRRLQELALDIHRQIESDAKKRLETGEISP
jgi:hypothetical protein